MPNTEQLQQYRDNRITTDRKFFKLVNNPILMNLFLLSKLPIGLFIGVKVKHIDAEQCQITVKYRWPNNNPFRSTYLGVLTIAAEISTGLPGLLATYDSKPSISMLATHIEGDFTKKATGITTFTCLNGNEIANTVEQAILTGEPQTFRALTIGTSMDGEEEARFNISWSFKARL